MATHFYFETANQIINRNKSLKYIIHKTIGKKQLPHLLDAKR